MADDPKDGAQGAEEDAPLSQADIDAALAGGGDASSPDASAKAGEQAAPTAGAGELSQADIDAALAGAGESTPPEPAASDEPTVAEDGALSQADIDAALAGGGDASSPDASAKAGEQVPPAAETGEFDQADVDALLADAGAGAVADSTPAPEPQPVPQPDARLDTAGRPFDEAAAAMAAAIEEEKAAAAQEAPAGRPLDLPDFTGGPDGESLTHGIDLLHDVSLRVKIELGRTRMFVEDVLKLGDGSVVELDKLAGDPVDVFANDQLIARGEVLILNDNFCVRVSEIISGGAATALKT